MRQDKHHINALGEHIMTLFFEWHTHAKKNQYWRFAFHDYTQLIELQEKLMPRGKKNPNDTTKSTGKPVIVEVEWINVRFTPEQIQGVLHLSENADDVGKALASLLVQGYGFSVRANTDRANFSAFITGISSHGGEKLYAISGFAPTALGAIASVLIKYYAILDDPSLLRAAKSTAGIG